MIIRSGTGGPAEFGAGGAGVGVDFGRGGADGFVGDGAVKAGAAGFLKAAFDAAIFTGMEGEDGNASARFEALREGAEEMIEHGEFVVHCDAEGLESAADGRIAFALANGARE